MEIVWSQKGLLELNVLSHYRPSVRLLPQRLGISLQGVPGNWAVRIIHTNKNKHWFV